MDPPQCISKMQTVTSQNVRIVDERLIFSDSVLF